MVTLQIAMSEERYEKIKVILDKAQAMFQQSKGIRMKYALVLEEILEEWCENKGLINRATGEKMSALSLIKNNVNELDYVRKLMETASKDYTAVPMLEEIINRVEPYWHPKIGESANKQVVRKAGQLFFDLIAEEEEE